MSRIFPTSKNESFERAANISTIDYEAVAAKTSGLLKKASVEKTEGKATRKPLRSVASKPAAAPATKIASVEELFLSGDEASVRIPSAEYLQKCIEAGDQENYRKAVALRSQVRRAMIEQAEAAEESVAQVVKEAEVQVEAKAEEKEEIDEPVEKRLEESHVEKVEEPKKKKADSVEETKTAVAARLNSLGFPKHVVAAYTEAMYAEAPEVPDFVSELASAEGISKEAKTKIFMGFLKESKLEDQDRKRFLDYWKNTFGYVPDYCEEMAADVDPVTGE